MGKMLVKAILCGIAGVVGWLIMEPSMPRMIGDPQWAAKENMMLFFVCTLIGLACGVFTGLQQGTKHHLIRSSLIGTFLGIAGGMLGYKIGGMLVAGIYGPDIFTRGAPLPVAATARMVALTPIGLGLGAAIGATHMSWRGLMSGAIGGFLGGLAAGALFDVTSFVLGPFISIATSGNEVGSPGRGTTFLLIGFLVGLFTGLLDFLTRHAWVRLVVGRNEGKDWPLDHAQTNFGRDERAHVPLFGDSNVAPLHAVIMKNGNQYTLHDSGSAIGIGMNGMRIQGPVILKPGDVFQVGTHTLQFLMKGHGANRGPESRVAPVPMTPVGAPVQPVPNVSMNPTMAAPSTATLVVMSGPLSGQRFPVQATLEVGREGSGIALSYDAQASRKHATFTATAAGLALQDLNSTNGCFVNSSRVSSALLKPGDLVQIGSTQFRVE